MAIQKEDVRRISRLARIALTDAERETFPKELSAILEFVEQLNQVDASDAKPLTGGTDLESVVREDTRDNTNTALEGHADKLIEAAPEKKQEWIRVKAVFE